VCALLESFNFFLLIPIINYYCIYVIVVSCVKVICQIMICKTKPEGHRPEGVGVHIRGYVIQLICAMQASSQRVINHSLQYETDH